MTAAQWQGALVIACFFVGTITLIGLASLPVMWHDRSRPQPRFHYAPPTDVQQQRAQIAKRRTEQARLKMLGHHGGAEFQQAEYAEGTARLRDCGGRASSPGGELVPMPSPTSLGPTSTRTAATS